jgi:hypothetical protein
MESDAKKRENERRQDELVWERSRQDETLRWLREQKLKYYVETLDHFQAASELSRHVEFPEDQNMVGPEAVKEVRQELRLANRSVNSLRAVCGDDLAEQVIQLYRELYFTIQHLDNIGMGPGHFVPLPGRPNGWILNETIDGWSERLTDFLRKDFGLT